MNMKRIFAHLLLGAAVAAALLPTAPAPAPTPTDPAIAAPALTDPAVPSPPKTLAPLGVPEWLPAAGGSTCEGGCDTGAAEIYLNVRCSTSSAASCCASLTSQCLHFSGTCAGDAEIVCQF